MRLGDQMGTKQKRLRQLTPLELQIMNVLWESRPSTVQDVLNRLCVRPRFDPREQFRLRVQSGTLERQDHIL